MNKNRLLYGLPLAMSIFLVTSAAAEPRKEISVDEIVEAFASKNKVDEQIAALHLKVNAEIDSQKNLLRSWSLESGSEIGMHKADERKLEAGISFRQILGFEESKAREKERVAIDSETLQSQIEIRERLVSVVKIYHDLKLQHRLVEVSSEILATIRPIASKARLAAEKGTVAFLSSSRWRLIERLLEDDRKGFEKNFEVLSDTLEKVSGFRAPLVSAVSFKAEATQELKEVDPRTHPSIQALENKRKTIEAEALNVRNHREFSARAGVTFDFAENKSVVKIGVEFPLSQGSVADSKAKAILAETDVIRTKMKFANDAAIEKIALMRGEYLRAKARTSILRARISDLSQLNELSLKAFGLGRAEAVEILETLKELYEQKTRLAETERDAANAYVELKLLFKEDLK